MLSGIFHITYTCGVVYEYQHHMLKIPRTYILTSVGGPEHIESETTDGWISDWLMPVGRYTELPCHGYYCVLDITVSWILWYYCVRDITVLWILLCHGYYCHGYYCVVFDKFWADMYQFPSINTEILTYAEETASSTPLRPNKSANNRYASHS